MRCTEVVYNHMAGAENRVGAAGISAGNKWFDNQGSSNLFAHFAALNGLTEQHFIDLKAAYNQGKTGGGEASFGALIAATDTYLNFAGFVTPQQIDLRSCAYATFKAGVLPLQ